MNVQIATVLVFLSVLYLIWKSTNSWKISKEEADTSKYYEELRAQEYRRALKELRKVMTLVISKSQEALPPGSSIDSQLLLHCQFLTNELLWPSDTQQEEALAKAFDTLYEAISNSHYYLKKMVEEKLHYKLLLRSFPDGTRSLGFTDYDKLMAKLRRGTSEEYASWLKGYLKAGGCITDSYDYETTKLRFFVATDHIKLVPLYGVDSLEIIVPEGLTVQGKGGHIDIFLMDGFTSNKTKWTPLFSDINFEEEPELQSLIDEARAQEEAFRAKRRKNSLACT